MMLYLKLKVLGIGKNSLEVVMSSKEIIFFFFG